MKPLAFLLSLILHGLIFVCLWTFFSDFSVLVVGLQQQTNTTAFRWSAEIDSFFHPSSNPTPTVDSNTHLRPFSISVPLQQAGPSNPQALRNPIIQEREERAEGEEGEEGEEGDEGNRTAQNLMWSPPTSPFWFEESMLPSVPLHSDRVRQSQDPNPNLESNLKQATLQVLRRVSKLSEPTQSPGLKDSKTPLSRSHEGLISKNQGTATTETSSGFKPQHRVVSSVGPARFSSGQASEHESSRNCLGVDQKTCESILTLVQRSGELHYRRLPDVYKIEAFVPVRFVLGRDGRASQIQVLQPGEKILDALAIHAIEQTRFPAVSTEVKMKLRFRPKRYVF